MIKQLFAPETIQSITDDLLSLPPTRKAKQVGKIQTIRQLEPAIRAARENGYTWEDIIQRLNKQHGLNTTVTAVRNYLGPRYAKKTPATRSGEAGGKPESDSKRQQREKERATGGRFIPPPDLMDI